MENKFMFKYGNVGFNFEYSTEITRIGEQEVAQRVTTVVTTNVVTGVVAKTSVVCDSRDRYEKTVGRKKAFTKLLSNIPSKTTRTELWEQYFSKCNK